MNSLPGKEVLHPTLEGGRGEIHGIGLPSLSGCSNPLCLVSACGLSPPLFRRGGSGGRFAFTLFRRVFKHSPAAAFRIFRATRLCFFLFPFLLVPPFGSKNPEFLFFFAGGRPSRSRQNPKGSNGRPPKAPFLNFNFFIHPVVQEFFPLLLAKVFQIHSLWSGSTAIFFFPCKVPASKAWRTARAKGRSRTAGPFLRFIQLASRGEGPRQRRRPRGTTAPPPPAISPPLRRFGRRENQVKGLNLASKFAF